MLAVRTRLLSAVLVILLVPSVIYSADMEEKEPMINPYKANYFVTGDMEDQVKFQLSVKYNILHPAKIGLYAGYTLMAWWRLWDFEGSSPFEEFNHNPELFLYVGQRTNMFNVTLPKEIDYIQIGIAEHKSNGVGGDTSRSMNRSYIQAQASTGKLVNVGINLKVWALYIIAPENPDLKEYIGQYRGEVFVRLRSQTIEDLDKERVYIAWGHSNSLERGWIEAGIETRIFTTIVQPRFFLQLWHGYCEGLVWYDEKTTAIRIGILFR